MPCLFVCQWLPVPAAGSGVRPAERFNHGALLLHDALCRLCHDVPPDPRPVSHQTLHHLQHAGGMELLSNLFQLHLLYHVIRKLNENVVIIYPHLVCSKPVF